VMSSLSRARERLRQSLTSLLSKDAAREASASTDGHQRTDSINWIGRLADWDKCGSLLRIECGRAA